MNFSQFLLKSFCLIIFLINLQGCGIYSFSGTSIPNEANTICVYYIDNKASLVEPNLSNNLTEMMYYSILYKLKKSYSLLLLLATTG